MPQKMGHYTVVSELGRGGMGVVLKGREDALNRFVAIKVLGEHLSKEPEFLSRFVREARAAAGLSHPNVIQIYFIGEDNGQHYFVMEYVSGRSVSALIKTEGRVGNPRAAQVILQAAHGLAAAHDQGIYHRDIKPANLMLDERGVLKIADFGLALPVEAQTRLTASGRIMGTPGYLSPEHCLGHPVDHRADIYALGITYYEMLTGLMPFNGDSPIALLRAILQDEPPDVQKLNPDVDAETRRILMKMLAKDREKDRYQDCHQLAADLEEYLGARNVRNLTTGLNTRLPGRSRASAADIPTSVLGAGTAAVTAADTPTMHIGGGDAATQRLADTPLPGKSTQPDVNPGDVPTLVGAIMPASLDATQNVSRPALSHSVPMSVAAKPSRSATNALVVAAVLVLLVAGGFGAYFGLRSFGKSKSSEAMQASVLPTGGAASPAQPTRSPLELSAPNETPNNPPSLAYEPASNSAQNNLTTTPPTITRTNVPPASAGGSPVVQTRSTQQQPVERAPQQTETRTVPAQRQARTPSLSGIAFAVVGDPGLNPAVASVLAAEIDASGLKGVNAEDLSETEGLLGGSDVSSGALIDRLRSAGVATLVLAKIKPTGQRGLSYMGRSDTAYGANVALTTYDVATGRPIGQRASANIEYTQLTAEREAEKIVGKLARKAFEALSNN